jgi:tRNA (Thr-GGU) A37 N-methylase
MLTITPIGTVRNEVKTPIVKGWGRVVSDLVLDERYTEALDGLEDFSHVLVIFWMDRAGAPKSLKDHVQGERSYLSRVFSLDVRHRVPIPSVSAPCRF